jgi:hypothetical protein
METMREAWTDERLDDLKDEMRRGFDRVDGDLRQLRLEMNERFTSVDARFDAMQRTMVIGFATLGGGLLASVAATILAVVLG